jgi:hypothetical protein
VNEIQNSCGYQKEKQKDLGKEKESCPTQQAAGHASGISR